MKILLILFLCVSTFSFAQTDTITIVSYNLLNFPEGRDDCGANTVVPNRSDTLRKIIGYTKPDVFVACEIQTEEGADSILTRSLNVYGATNYAAATFNLNSSGAGLHNMLYYNSDKLTLQWQDFIQTSSRDIDHYVLYVNDPNLGVYFDTTFIEVYMCHLKAGSGGSNQAIRDAQTQELMSYIATRPTDRNHFVCGDLNVYTSSEQGYQNMVTGPFALEDPINAPGSWNNNGSFAAIHTQSTRSSLNYDCGASGGCDDRFDQILVSSNVMSGGDSLKYLANSYDAVGNDGNHYNTNLLAGPTNSQYPDSIVRALYYMSDHLPVLLKTVVTYPTSNGLALYPVVSSASCNGASDGEATIVPNDGQVPYSYQWDVNSGSQTTQTATGLASGAYCVTVTDNLGEVDDYCVYISDPAPITYSTFITAESANCNGVVHLIVGGGTGPYDITWNDPLNQTGQSAYDLCAGQYQATIIDAEGCTLVVDVEILDQTNSIDELELSSFRIYPNPVSDQLRIVNESGTPIISIEVLNYLGQQVKTEQISQDLSDHELDVSILSNGYYLIRIVTSKGVQTISFVKK